MPRPEFITQADIIKWNIIIDSDSELPKEFYASPAVRESCFAGLWLAEELQKLDCPEIIITRIQFTAGKLSYGRDAWEVSKMMLEAYKKDELVFEPDSDSPNN
jgi:hypothetical protein